MGRRYRDSHGALARREWAHWNVRIRFNPVVYLVSGFRWSFYEIADVHIGVSLAMTGVFLAVCLMLVTWIFRTGYRLKT